MSKNEEMMRRNFLKKTSAGIGLGVMGASISGSASEPNTTDRLPRDIWIASLTLEGLEAKTSEALTNKVLRRMEETLACKPDIICLPETFPYEGVSEIPPLSDRAEKVPGPITGKFVAFAEKHHCYIICPMHTKNDGRIYNSAVVIDRKGGIVGEYHKIHPTVDEIESGVCPGAIQPPTFETDFGTIGIQICFDVNWHEAWRSLRDSGAEIIFWPSAFPGGRMLNALAWINKTYVVTSTRPDPARIIDITGDDVAVSGRFEHWVCAPVNLEKAFIHIWPYVEKIDALRAKYRREIRVTKMHQEDWAVIESVSADVPLAAALKEFDIPIHEEHIRRAQKTQEKARRV
jgi:predicted amidohydrolase